MPNTFKSIVDLWREYNHTSHALTAAMGGTSNEVGEFAELLVAKYYAGNRLPASSKSADIRLPDGTTIQVKSRKLVKVKSTSLNVIRSWDFDLLVIVLFSTSGDVLKAITLDSDTARSLAKENKHQNGYIITTSSDVLNCSQATDLTEQLNGLLKVEHTHPTPYLTKQFPSGTPKITLIPNNPDLFKKKLIESRIATRKFVTLDGNILTETWHANNINENSDLLANIRTNSKYRNWRTNGIKEVILEVITAS